MFRKPTVFVVGAGGSCELGMPSGAALKSTIAEKTRYTVENGRRNLGDWEMFEALVSPRSGLDQNKLVNAARNLSKSMPLALSIDNYLHTHSGDSYAVAIGKAAIATAIMEEEAKTRLHVKSHENVDFRAIEPSWHAEFFKMAAEGVRTDEVDTMFKNVAIVTFNYDRIIEHYLAHAVERYFRVSKDEAEQLCAGLPVFHVYGQVGRLPWQTAKNGSVVHPFGGKPTWEIISQISGQIKTFTESETDEKKQSLIRGFLAEAQTVVFLGFSFGKMNLDYLQVDRQGSQKHVYATAHGVPNENLGVITNAVENTLTEAKSVVRSISFSDSKCREFMEKYWWPITAE